MSRPDGDAYDSARVDTSHLCIGVSFPASGMSTARCFGVISAMMKRAMFAAAPRCRLAAAGPDAALLQDVLSPVWDACFRGCAMIGQASDGNHDALSLVYT